MEFRVVSVDPNLAHGRYVPLGAELLTADLFSGVVEWEGGRAELEVANVEGRFEARAIRNLSLSTRDVALRQTDLRLPLAAMAQAIGRRVAFSATWTEFGGKLTPAGELGPGDVPRRRRARITPEFLEKVARAYTDALADGRDPTAAVRDTIQPYGVRPPRSTASRWIKAASDHKPPLITERWEPPKPRRRP